MDDAVVAVNADDPEDVAIYKDGELENTFRLEVHGTRWKIPQVIVRKPSDWPALLEDLEVLGDG